MRIAFDPGHGGADKGVVAGGFVEAALNYDLALLLQREFPGSILTREPGEDPSPKERALRAADADLVLCLHHNSGSAEQRGREVYVIGTLPQLLAPFRAFGRVFNTDYYRTSGDNAWAYLQRSEHCLRHFHQPAILLEVGYLTDPIFCAGLRHDGQKPDAKVIQGLLLKCKELHEGAIV